MRTNEEGLGVLRPEPFGYGETANVHSAAHYRRAAEVFKADPAALLAATLAYAALGWHVFALTPGGRAPRAGTAGHLDATTDPDTIRRWWARWPLANIGIALAPSGLAVVDLDRHQQDADGVATMAELVASYGPLPAGPSAETARGGRHFYFPRPAGMEPRRAIGVAPGVDLLAAGYAIMPPSAVAAGCWRWLTAPDAAELPALPWWVVALAAPPERPPEPRTASRATPTKPAGRYAAAALAREALAVMGAPAGQRNASLNAGAFSLGSLAAGCQLAGVPCFGEAEAWHALMSAATANGLALDRGSGGERGCWATFRSGWRSGWACPREVASRAGVRR